MKVIEIKGLTKFYGDRSHMPKGFGKITNILNPKKRSVLDNVTIDVNEGEVFGLIGPNGAGKTTLIKIAAGLLAPDAGTASLLGHKMPDDHDKIASQYNAVFARASIYSRLTGYDNLLFFAKIYRVREPEKKVGALLKEFEIESRANDYADTYSTGEIMRFNLARSLLNDPKVLFVDEPTIGLDPRIALKVRDILGKLNKERRMTIFLTTHYMDEAEQLCSRMAFLNNGKIVREGSPEEVRGNSTLEKAFLSLTGTPLGDEQ